MLVGSRAGAGGHCWAERGPEVGEEDLLDIPPAVVPGTSGLFLFQQFCSQSPVCTEQASALLDAPGLWRPKP